MDIVIVAGETDFVHIFFFAVQLVSLLTARQAVVWLLVEIVVLQQVLLGTEETSCMVLVEIQCDHLFSVRQSGQNWVSVSDDVVEHLFLLLMVLWLSPVAVVSATRISDDLIGCNLRWANDFRQVHHVAFL